MPEGIVRKWIVIFQGCPLGVPIDQPNVELVIPACDIFAQKFQPIVQTVWIQSMVIQPYIPVPVCRLEIRQWEIIPTFFYVNKNIQRVIVPIGETDTGIHEKRCIHEVLTAHLQSGQHVRNRIGIVFLKDQLSCYDIGFGFFVSLNNEVSNDDMR